MLSELYKSLKDQLLAIDGMVSRPYQVKSGNGPKGGIEEFLLNERYFAGLRLTDKFLMLYLMPLYCYSEFDTQLGERLKPVRSGKSCLKITKPEKLDREAVTIILEKGTPYWLQLKETV